MIEDEKTFRKDLFDMTEMVKVLYEERNNSCKEKFPSLPMEKALQEEVTEKKVMGTEANLHHLHHILLRNHLHPLPLIPLLLILTIILQKGLVSQLS